jgi:hypothetical protein
MRLKRSGRAHKLNSAGQPVLASGIRRQLIFLSCVGASIIFAKYFFSGYEAVASGIACALGFFYVFAECILKHKKSTSPTK